MKEVYLKDIDLRKRKNLNYIYNTEEIKIIQLELEIKHPQISMSSKWNIVVEWYLPTNYKNYESYKKWEIMQWIQLLKWYECIWLMSDKYTLIITLKRYV